ncbi:hypothetical protein [Paeniglutamicibacter cryotolerans]|uniref:Uncharacterized protein n=1 Tax=Paeniglutamicibacter cryotolerans TaxID=670079 RepID=A0A839QKE7_9MICC|nr:hypothetical protein [Paeniglutamicibacter cryotolerans]MBB2994506.1 hypothetical protein [Paeniglutamicibacter cryotolerans]
MDLDLSQTIIWDDVLSAMAVVAEGRGISISISIEVSVYAPRGIDIVESAEDPIVSALKMNMHATWHRGHYAKAKIRETARQLRPWAEPRQSEAR